MATSSVFCVASMARTRCWLIWVLSESIRVGRLCPLNASASPRGAGSGGLENANSGPESGAPSGDRAVSTDNDTAATGIEEASTGRTAIANDGAARSGAIAEARTDCTAETAAADGITERADISTGRTWARRGMTRARSAPATRLRRGPRVFIPRVYPNADSPAGPKVPKEPSAKDPVVNDREARAGASIRIRLIWYH